MTPRRKAFCAEVSRDNAEPLAATASRVDHWILVEYRGLWAHDAVDGSALSPEVKEHLRVRRHARPNTKLMFVRRTERRDRAAGNVVVLPDGLYYGRVEPADVWALADEQLAGRVLLDRYRGRSCYTF